MTKRAVCMIIAIARALVVALGKVLPLQQCLPCRASPCPCRRSRLPSELAHGSQVVQQRCSRFLITTLRLDFRICSYLLWRPHEDYCTLHLVGERIARRGLTPRHRILQLGKIGSERIFGAEAKFLRWCEIRRTFAPTCAMHRTPACAAHF